ncbi:universal stress protein [Cellulophaga sp. Hel_I_12]|uniref:universal stress protein n=1 Tax=Cellulophaga sp. Hel_I_12 TaxID=1249972 RepID=UPI000647B6CF|nr:universal stress protein [Cellulophaga sp. Hel_I_12]
MKNILIPTDFSNNAWRALQYAVTFFDNIPCHFYILHVGTLYESGVQHNSFLTFQENNKLLIKEKIADLEAQIKALKINNNHTFSITETYGNLIHSIRKTIDKKNIDLIVMGTKGASGLKKVIGSNTGDVITKVATNVLVIPEKTNFISVKNIALLTDYTIFYSHAILEEIAEVLHTNQAKLKVLNFAAIKKSTTPFQEQNRVYLKDYLNELFTASHSFETMPNKKVATVVEEFTATRKIEMLMMTAKNLNFLEQLLFDSAAEQLSFHTKLPLFVLHE